MRRFTLSAIAGCIVVGLALLAWLAFAPRSPEPQASPKEVRVAAAADLQFAFDDVVKAFRADHPDIAVQVNYGASGNFYSQLSNHAPFDLFLSADIDYPRKLIEQGLAEKDSEFLYAVGHLVVWVPKSSPLDVEKTGIKTLLDPSVKKVAIANPRHAPYGRAAEAALKSLGVYEQVKDKLVLGENVAQTAQFVQSGAVDVGLIALSLAVAPAVQNQGRYWEVPLDVYPRLEQGGVILSWVQNKQAAESLRAFLLSPKGKAILKRFGFFLQGE
jgi:molybdate transport system substrate-binding protein